MTSGQLKSDPLRSNALVGHDKDGGKKVDPATLPQLMQERLKETGKKLTVREAHVAQLIAAGKNRAVIMKELGLSRGALSRIRTHLTHKLRAPESDEIVALFTNITPSPDRFAALDKVDLEILQMRAHGIDVRTIAQQYDWGKTAISMRVKKISEKIGTDTNVETIALYKASAAQIKARRAAAEFRDMSLPTQNMLPPRVRGRLGGSDATLTVVEYAHGRNIALGKSGHALAAHAGTTVANLNKALAIKLGVATTHAIAALFSTATPQPALFAHFTERQHRILRDLSRGLNEDQIAKKCGIDVDTVRRSVTTMKNYVRVSRIERLIAVYVSSLPDPQRDAYITADKVEHTNPDQSPKTMLPKTVSPKTISPKNIATEETVVDQPAATQKARPYRSVYDLNQRIVSASTVAALFMGPQKPTRRTAQATAFGMMAAALT